MRVCLTIDTEMSMGAHRRGTSLRRNFELSIKGLCADGEFGAFYQARSMRRRGLTGVFFVDPLPTMSGGGDVVRETVETLLELGQDVQLHVHTEWLDRAEFVPKPGLGGDLIADYDMETQARILDQAAALLVEAGAPRPTAFRAGNYGANDDTLRALAKIGIRHDASFDAGYGDVMISLPLDLVSPVEHYGVIEFPTSGLLEAGRWRHLQICAVTARQMRTALTDAAAQGYGQQTLLSHSFELLTRDRTRLNPVHRARFRDTCDFIAANPDRFTTGSFVEPSTGAGDLAPPETGRLAALRRRGSQLYKNLRYERAYIYARLRGRQSVHWGGKD